MKEGTSNPSNVAADGSDARAPPRMQDLAARRTPATGRLLALQTNLCDEAAARKYFAHHRIRELFDRQAQCLFIQRPSDPFAFLQGDLAQHSLQRDDVRAVGLDGACRLSMVVEYEEPGCTTTRKSFSRIVPAGSKMAVLSAETDARALMHAAWAPETLCTAAGTAQEQDRLLAAAVQERERVALRAKFDKFADCNLSADASQHRLSKDALAKALADANVECAEDELEGLLARFDLNSDGEISFEEFRIMVNNNSNVMKVLKSLAIEDVLAAFMPKGSADNALSAFFDMNKTQVKTAVLAAVEPVTELIWAAIAKAAKAAQSQSGGGGGKMGGLLQGGTIEEFYKGVTGITGEPHPDLEEGVRKEHCDMPDSLEVYTSGNYGISTVPKTEYELVVGGGEGLETIQVKQPDGITFVEHVIIPNTANLKSRVQTRGPVKEGQLKEDLRVIRPLFFLRQIWQRWKIGVGCA